MNDELQNEVFYSISSAKLLERCPRAYWYTRYRSWHGWWNKGQPPERAAGDAYEAKHFTDGLALAGTVVHSMAKRALDEAKEGVVYDSRETMRNTLLQRARVILDRKIDQARERVIGPPKKTTRLVEFEFNMEFDEDAVRQRARDGIEALTGLDDAWYGQYEGTNLFMRMIGRPASIIMADQLLSYADVNSGLKVFLQCDVAVRAISSDSSIFIIDWKTGSKTSGRGNLASSVQLHTYRKWAESRGWKDVNTLLVYLSQDGADVVVPDSCDEAGPLSIEWFIAELRRRLVDGDIKKNVAIESKFEPTKDLSECVKCPFQSICARDGTKPR